MRTNSLAFRLIAAASVWSVIALVAGLFILTSLYRQNAEQAFDERLGVYLDTLIGRLAVQPASGFPADPGNLGEQLFQVPFSGWYWQVQEASRGPVLLTSPSLFSDVLDLSRISQAKQLDDGADSGLIDGPESRTLRVQAQTVSFDDTRRYDVVVAGDVADLEAQVGSFQRTVLFILVVFALGLILASATQIRWGLKPLDRVRRGLSDLRSGKQTRFAEGLPSEIEPLVTELNALLESNKEVIDRARTQVGNLAHALKTPLSVIVNEAHASRAPKIAEQAEIMRGQINHYLDRARIAAQVNVIGVVTDVEPAIARLVRAMSRIHDERGIELSLSSAPGVRFRGEQQDLEEIAGNLIDNACKWARGRVSINIAAPADSTVPGGDRFTMTIDDDGPGLTPEQAASAMARGKRLDESKPGSGLGLSIVTDLTGLYQGTFHLSRSPAGGLRAVVQLPAAT